MNDCRHLLSTPRRRSAAPQAQASRSKPNHKSHPGRDSAPNRDYRLNKEHAANPADATNDPKGEPPALASRSPTDNHPGEAPDQPPIKPPDPIKQIQDAWAARYAENLARAKPGSVHEAIARIYANPESIELDP